MALPIKLIAVVATTAASAAAAAGAYMALRSPNAGPTTTTRIEKSDPWAKDTGPSTEVPEEGPDDLTLCVGGDRILRVPPGFGKECPSGQQELLLAWDVDERLCELCDSSKDPPSEPPSDNEALNALDERIRDLENTSYFEVVNKDEKPIFQVRPGGVRMLNDQQRTVALVGTPAAGSYFTARSPAGAQATMSASAGNVGVLLGEVNNDRVELGTRNAGPHALRFPSGKGLIAGIGQSRAGTGAVLVGTLPGVTAGSITATDGRGMISLTKDGLPGGIAFTESINGGGLVDIGNNVGDSAVKMGHNRHRYGVVMTGPVPGLPYVPRSGLPGSYFFGCASGEKPACTPTAPE
jgi:hypothetical protein